MKLNKHILPVIKWQYDPKSVSKDELVKNRDAAYAAHAAHATYFTYDVYVAAAYAADAADADAADADADAARWVNNYFEETGESKQDYLDAIEVEKVGSKKEPTQEWVDGLPPIGCECEVFHGEEWIKCLFIGVGLYDDYIYQISSGEYKGELNGDKNTSHFRPLKTQEQKDREAFIEKCVQLTEMDGAMSIEGFGIAYDNGARFKAPEGG